MSSPIPFLVPHATPRRVSTMGLIHASWLIAPIVCFFTWIGWGHWGYSVIGDYCLDMADALRVFQGDVPYRDFIPTYGALHLMLVAPLFHLGRAFFPALWILTAILIFTQLVVLTALGRRFLSAPWLITLVALAVGCVVFAPSNSKFILGYSQSGFLASFLLTAALALLGAGPPSPQRWTAVGVLLGLLPFTKIDIGLTGVTVAGALVVAWWRPARAAALRLALATLATWFAACLLLALRAGRVDLLIGSTTETFGQVGLTAEPLLASRMRLLVLLGALLAAGLATPGLRAAVCRLTRVARPWIPLLLPLALLADFLRSWPSNPVKHLVIFDWFCSVAFVVTLAHVAAAILRQRSLRPLRAGPRGLLLPLLVITGMGLLRVQGAGWFPLNYFQPAPLLLGILWVTGSRLDGRRFFTCGVAALLALALSLQVAVALAHCRPRTVERLSTPYGEIGFLLGPQLKGFFQRTLQRLGPANHDEVLLCTYEPSFHILTGMRFVEFYSYFNRLGFTGARSTEREREALELLERRPPDFVLWDREAGRVHRRFGVDYGLAIAEWIRTHYEVAACEDGSTLYQKRKL